MISCFLQRCPSTMLSSCLMSPYKNAQIGFQTSTLPFGLDMLQARLASAHLHGVSMDTNCWHGRCSRTTAPADAIGLPAARPASALLPALPCLAGSLAGSRFAEGRHCVCTHREAHLCASLSSDCLCFAASTRVFRGRRTRSSVPAGRRRACRHRWCSRELVPSAKPAQSFRSLDAFSRDQQRYETHFG